MKIMRKNHFSKTVTTLIALMFAVSLLSGCGSSKYASDTAYNNSYSKTETQSSAPAANYGEGFAMYDEDSYSAETSASTQTTDYDNGEANDNRKLIKRFSLILETLDFESSCAMVNNYVRQYNGYIESSDIRNNDYYTIYYNNYDSRSASYTIRIPNDLVDGFVNKAGDIGSITSQSESSEDITLSYLDVESRAKALEIQQARLLALLEEAGTIEDIIALERRLSDVTYELESKESMLRNYDNLVSYSTVTLTLNEVKRISEPVPETMGERISSGWRQTWRDIADGFQDFIVWFVVNFPYIVIWLIVLALSVVIICAIVKAFKKNGVKQYEKKQKKLQKQQEEYLKRQAAAQTAAQTNAGQTDTRSGSKAPADDTVSENKD